VYIPERVINRPDPCIYSQFLLMQLEQPVTWDNPDVAIFLSGVEQNTYDLTADTEYDVAITAHNTSRWIEFGAGSQIRHPIATLTADVPVWPGVATVSTQWRTPATPGHYCIEVELAHPDDGNPSNNRGWNNTQVKVAASEVQVPIRIFNRWVAGIPVIPAPRARRTWVPIVTAWGGVGLLAGVVAAVLTPDLFPWWRFIYWPVIGYLVGFFAGFGILGPPHRKRERRQPDAQLPDIPRNLIELTVDSYRFQDRKGKEADPDRLFAQRPPVWSARLEPRMFHFGDNEAYRDVQLIVDVPDGSSGPEAFNINARQGGEPTGGVTVHLFTETEV
jgi:hypothetical protein